jgi:hypothetical protein
MVLTDLDLGWRSGVVDGDRADAVHRRVHIVTFTYDDDKLLTGAGAMTLTRDPGNGARPQPRQASSRTSSHTTSMAS